ncbi:MAG: hypothetical protein VBE63_15350 [Lamprobacter sp.]|uniref:hypothetical protein n=1 Tax=Lamprobacter sp. TaxID=3100796 RepID=UPI002B26299E|nr:hypothetical protein [Lamprobacter sp.]MEA3641300.1 hypothetical protein [Lamprobacter sp.]
MTIFLHSISIGLYLYVVIKAIRRHDMETSLKTTVVGACSFAILLSLVFSAMQVDWIIRNNHDAIGEDASIVWLIFDYLLVVYLISVGQVINVVVSWSRSTGRRKEPIIKFSRHGSVWGAR